MALRTILFLTKGSQNEKDLSMVLSNATGAICIERPIDDLSVLRGLSVDAVCYTADVGDIVNSTPFREALSAAMSLSCYGLWLCVEKHQKRDYRRGQPSADESYDSLEEWLGQQI